MTTKTGLMIPNEDLAGLPDGALVVIGHDESEWVEQAERPYWPEQEDEETEEK